MRSLTPRTPRSLASSLGAAATTVAAFSLAALLTPACARAQVNGYDFANVADSAGPFNSFFAPSLNASGQIAFLATLDTGGSGLFASNTTGAAPTTVATTAGPFSLFGGTPSLNASGQVAFLANLDAGGLGIFAGTTAGGLTTRVIGTGDALFGSTVASANFFREGLNDNGDIAFFYILADGRRGIAVASAAEVIPEPGTLVLAGLPLAAMVGRAIRRRRHNR